MTTAHVVDVAGLESHRRFPRRAIGDVLVIDIVGQLALSNRQELKQVVVDAMADDARLKFVIDFSTAGYVDNTGLGLLVSLNKRVREAGGHLVLCGLNSDLRTLFELTKLDTLFDVATTRDVALLKAGEA